MSKKKNPEKHLRGYPKGDNGGNKMAFKDLFKKGLDKAKGAYETTKSDIAERIDLAKEERRADRESERMAKSEARQIRRSARADRIKNIARFKEKQKEKLMKKRIESGPRFLQQRKVMSQRPVQRSTRKTGKKPKGFLKGRKVSAPPPRRDLTRVGLNVDYLGGRREENPRKPMRWI